MILSAADIVALELISTRAWPAARESGIGGWRLYATSGFSGRINACWPLGEPDLPTAEAVAAAETWYDGQGLAPVFKIVDRAFQPPGLVDHLSSHGYRARTETIMMTGPVGGLGDSAVALGEAVDDGVAAVFAATADSPGDARERLETLARIPGPRAVARLDMGGVPAAIGACAVGDGWAGLFAMRTETAHRRQGLARRVLGALLAWERGAGADRAWLQVEADNAAAISLYAAAGFVEVYRYRYWSRPGSVAPSPT
jgi:GNAT superfamily N-acetyltransferase